MKKHNLEIEVLRDEGQYVNELFSKGHHEEKEFKKYCKETMAEEEGEEIENIEESYPNIDDAVVQFIYGKKVGWFQDNKRIGWQLEESKEAKKGYFPMTTIEI